MGLEPSLSSPLLTSSTGLVLSDDGLSLGLGLLDHDDLVSFLGAGKEACFFAAPNILGIESGGGGGGGGGIGVLHTICS